MKSTLRGALLLWVGLALPWEAAACGGCFAPPTVAQVVTDHRMVLSVSTTQTTLWDQFQFSGSPDDFSWILPLRYSDGVRIAVGSDVFITALANLSAPLLSPPVLPWPACPHNPPPYCGPPPTTTPSYDSVDVLVYEDAPSSSTGVDRPPPVEVLREEVAGPYEVRVIRGTDPMEIRMWLRTNGYAVPAAIEPVIDFYTEQRMDFLAMRLRPMKGINRIAPIRVTFPGAVMTLPLRMIAAGVADRVGLALFVLSGARVEADNFPNDQYADDDFTFDWNRRFAVNTVSLFTAAFDRRNAAVGGRLWLTESSSDADTTSFRFVTRPPSVRDAGTSVDAGIGGADAASDVTAAFTGLGGHAQLTRLRADLPGRMLDRDLVLRASDLGRRGAVYAYGHQVNIPPPPTCPDGSRYDPATQRFVGARPWPPCSATPSGGCSVPTGERRNAWGWVGAVSVLLVVARARRRRRYRALAE